MTRKCIVPQCKSGYASNKEKVSLFHIPKNIELYKKWIQAIPKTRVTITSAHLVCEKHFTALDIIREFVHKDAAGNIIAKVAFQHPRLVDTAVPSIFPNLQDRSDTSNDTNIKNVTEHEVSKEITDSVADLTSTGFDECINTQRNAQVPTSVENLITCQVTPTYSTETHKICSYVAIRDHDYTCDGAITDLQSTNESREIRQNHAQENPVRDANIQLSDKGSTLTLKDCFSEILNNENFIEIPMGWFRYTANIGNKWVAFSTFGLYNHGNTLQPLIRKSVLVSEDGSVNISAHGKTLSPKNLSLLCNHIETVPELSHLLKTLSSMGICSGLAMLRDAQSVQSNDAYQDSFGEWRHNDCPVLCTKKICTQCRRLKKTLQTKNQRLKQNKNPKRIRLVCKTEEDREKYMTLHKRIRSDAAALRRARERIKKLERNIFEAQTTIEKLKKQSISDKCDMLN